jgi:hypothetical protein
MGRSAGRWSSTCAPARATDSWLVLPRPRWAAARRSTASRSRVPRLACPPAWLSVWRSQKAVVRAAPGTPDGTVPALETGLMNLVVRRLARSRRWRLSPDGAGGLQLASQAQLQKANRAAVDCEKARPHLLGLWQPMRGEPQRADPGGFPGHDIVPIDLCQMGCPQRAPSSRMSLC